MTVKISNLDDNKTVMDMFPVGMYARHNILTHDENDILMRKVQKMREVFGIGNTEEWLSGKYSPDNCFKISCLTESLEFQPLIGKVTEAVHECARYYGSFGEYECTNGWYNVYTSGRYQEFHIHPGNIFSVVYFLQVPDGAPGITFKRPGFGGMMPPKDIQVESPWHQEFMVAPPKEGTVVIFRSDLYHSVPPLTFDGERVTIALNFA